MCEVPHQLLTWGGGLSKRGWPGDPGDLSNSGKNLGRVVLVKTPAYALPMRSHGTLGSDAIQSALLVPDVLHLMRSHRPIAPKIMQLHKPIEP